MADSKIGSRKNKTGRVGDTPRVSSRKRRNNRPRKVKAPQGQLVATHGGPG